MSEPECNQCFGAGWVLDCKVDKDPTTLELLPCLIPDCPFSGRDVAVLCLYGRWESPVLHPKTGAVMSLSRRPDDDAPRCLLCGGRRRPDGSCEGGC